MNEANYSIKVYNIPRWAVYTGISSLLCILGGLMVPLASRYYKSRNGINSKLLNYGLSVSAGSMLCTSIYVILPRNTETPAVVFLGFLAGVVLSFGVNYLVHHYTSESLLHCGHDDMDAHTDGLHEDVEVEVVYSETEHIHQINEDTVSERQPLVPNKVTCQVYNGPACIQLGKSKSMGSLRSSNVIGTCNSDRKLTMCLENNIGYDLENLATYREHFMAGTLYYQSDRTAEENSAYSGSQILDSLAGNSDRYDHRHVVATPFSKLFSIGIQTCVVLMLHKFPEGFIIFCTSREELGDQNMGFAIFLSLAVHNLIEGFTMTLPMYSALETKWLAVAVTIAISAGSQPVGAILGYLAFRNRQSEGEPDITILLTITAGFLFVLALQMFQTAVAFSDTHHHHEDDDGDDIKDEHSSGTVCLRWCCFGVLLILASSAFTHHH